MIVVFLPRALSDLRWFRRYYEAVFPEGAARAREQFGKSLETLKQHARAGRTG